MNKGYIAASLTVLIWGLTFVSTKILLTVFTPVEILFIRFAIGFIALLAVSPKRLRSKGWQEEKYFILAGLTGIFFYYFLENASMLWTGASNAGVIVSTAPFFTALFSGEKKSKRFFSWLCRCNSRYSNDQFQLFGYQHKRSLGRLPCTPCSSNLGNICYRFKENKHIRIP